MRNPVAVVFTSLILVCTLFAPTLWARQCSLETIKGKYSTLEQGTIVGANPANVPTPAPVVLTANATFDGAGKFSGTYAENAGGGFGGGTFSGTYEVTSDCTYSATFDVFIPGVPVAIATLSQTGHISGEGTLQEIRYIYTDNFLVVAGTLKKQ